MKTEFFNVTRPLEVMWRLAFTEQKILWNISISTILFDKKTNEICLQLKRRLLCNQRCLTYIHSTFQK